MNHPPDIYADCHGRCNSKAYHVVDDDLTRKVCRVCGRITAVTDEEKVEIEKLNDIIDFAVKESAAVDGAVERFCHSNEIGEKPTEKE